MYVKLTYVWVIYTWFSYVEALEALTTQGLGSVKMQKSCVQYYLPRRTYVIDAYVGKYASVHHE